MGMELETVTIVAANAKGRKIINKSDFDPAKHTLFGAKPKPAPKATPAKRGRPKKKAE
jgi:hypothetical protein